MARAQVSISTYDVFLNFRGEDTRNGFTRNLYDALIENDIKAFMDDEGMEKGEVISNVLIEAIERSKIAITVLSEKYASSSWCLDELVKILDRNDSNGLLVIPVFYKIEPTVIRKQLDSYREAMAKHEKKYTDGMAKVRGWRSALSKVAEINGWITEVNKPEKKLIKEIVEDVKLKIGVPVDNEEEESSDEEDIMPLHKVGVVAMAATRGGCGGLSLSDEVERGGYYHRPSMRSEERRRSRSYCSNIELVD